MMLAILVPVLEVAAAFVAARIAWWLVGDLVLDSMDLPF
jgi:hypothetical protein